MQAYACVTQMFAVHITLMLICVVKGLILSQGLKKKGMLLWMVFAHAIGVNKFWFLVYSYLSNCIVCFT